MPRQVRQGVRQQVPESVRKQERRWVSRQVPEGVARDDRSGDWTEEHQRVETTAWDGSEAGGIEEGSGQGDNAARR